MARPLNRLSARTAATLKEPGRHADGGGLYLQVDPTGAKRWVFVFQWDKKRKEMGLGSLRLVSLAEAREAALAARKLVAKQLNPIEARKQSDAPTFGAVANELMVSLEVGWRNAKHKSQWRTSLEVYAKPLRDKQTADITTADVIDVLKPIWSRIPETASRTRGRIERVLDAAKANGLRAGENPARWRGHLALLLPKQKGMARGHHPALAFADAPAFMRDLRAREAMAARALEHTILTAARTNEALGARRKEIDLKAKVWTVPADRMKLHIEHAVPLSPAALANLESVIAAYEEATGVPMKPDELIFQSPSLDGSQLSNMAMDMLLRRMGREAVSVHGFRSTFRDWAGEKTEYPSELAELALAHQVGDEVERAYRRGRALEKRRGLMNDWGVYLASLGPRAT